MIPISSNHSSWFTVSLKSSKLKHKDRNHITLAYVTRCFKRFSGIYRSLLYIKAYASYKVTTKHVENGTLRVFTYIAQRLSCTMEVDISLISSPNGGWHRLGFHPIRSTFHRLKRGKRNIENFINPAFRVFNGENWNGLDGNLAYVTPCFKSLSGIYWSLLYMKAFASYKVTTKHMEDGTLWLFSYISAMLSSTAEIYISP